MADTPGSSEFHGPNVPEDSIVPYGIGLISDAVNVAARLEGLNKNFAGLFPLFDVVFGTYHMPRGRLPERFGLARESVPETILGQLAYPFRRPKPPVNASP